MECHRSRNSNTSPPQPSSSYSDETMTTEHPWRNESRLRRLYVEEEWTQSEIADELDCTEATVRSWLERFEIERESPPWRNEKALRSLRDDCLSQAEIADKLGCSQATVRNWMKRSGMDTSKLQKPKPWRDEEVLRRLYVDQELTMEEVASTLNCGRQAVEEWIHRHGIPTRSRNPDPPDELTRKTTLRELYVEEGSSTYSIAEELDCAPSAVHGWLQRHGIETRSVGSQPGELHHRWKGGFDPYYGRNWHGQRRNALRRDNYKCKHCGITENAHREQYKAGLDVHHITPFRRFDKPVNANQLDNLVTLCRRCHNRLEGEEMDFNSNE